MLALAAAGCSDTTAPPSGLPVVLTITKTETGQACTGDPAEVAFRVAAHRVPRGRYDVVLRQQSIRSDGSAMAPVELVRQAVSFP